MQKPSLTSNHQIEFEDAHDMSAVDDQSVHLVITSPPYPMIEMWDDAFKSADPAISEALKKTDPNQAFEGMHQVLDGIWLEIGRVLVPGGIVCINIGDATRTIQNQFRLYANHARIIHHFHAMGFQQLPSIIWRKTTNAPNKFMGSGMMPPGAYVTLEHEYILIFRNGPKRAFSDEKQKQLRRQSAYFWEERNQWFSDVWMGLTGTTQNLKNSKTRQRSAAFPIELPYRLLSMFSIKGDTILDPFLGSGTTMLAAMSAGRNCIGYEIDEKLQPNILQKIATLPETAQQIIDERIAAHNLFVKERMAVKGDMKYANSHYGFPVMTQQEQDLCFYRIKNIQYLSKNCFTVSYLDPSQADIEQDAPPPLSPRKSDTAKRGRPKAGRQLKLF